MQRKTEESLYISSGQSLEGLYFKIRFPREDPWTNYLCKIHFLVLYKLEVLIEQGNDMCYNQRRSQPDNLVPLCKFQSVTSIHFFRN